MSVFSIDTAIAIVDRDAQGLIRIRVKEGARMDVQGFTEILAARKQLAEDKPSGVIAILPDDVDLDVKIMNVDHYRTVDAASFTKAFAIVTEASFYARLYELYAAYFKPDFPVKVFADEAGALVWVQDQLSMDNGA